MVPDNRRGDGPDFIFCITRRITLIRYREHTEVIVTIAETHYSTNAKILFQLRNRPSLTGSTVMNIYPVKAFAFNCSAGIGHQVFLSLD